MRIANFQLVALTALMTVIWTSNTSAVDTTRRGLDVDQGGNVNVSSNTSNSAGTRTWYVDVQDNFNRAGSLIGSETDTWQVGFIPPRDKDPDSDDGRIAHGPLQGTLADEFGRWTGDGDYLVEYGQVRLNGAGGVAVQPWRVLPGMGVGYLAEATATVAEGESVIIGFAGDPASASDNLLDGEYGQLVLGVERVDADSVSWQVKWDTDNGFSVTGGVEDNVGSGELRLQLAWDELNNTFDAWLDDTPLSGIQSMGLSGISTHAIAFQLTGGVSSISNFTTAIPEPSTCLLMLMGIIGLTSYRGRRQNA